MQLPGPLPTMRQHEFEPAVLLAAQSAAQPAAQPAPAVHNRADGCPERAQRAQQRQRQPQQGLHSGRGLARYERAPDPRARWAHPPAGWAVPLVWHGHDRLWERTTLPLGGAACVPRSERLRLLRHVQLVARRRRAQLQPVHLAAKGRPEPPHRLVRHVVQSNARRGRLRLVDAARAVQADVPRHISRAAGRRAHVLPGRAGRQRGVARLLREASG